MSEESKYVLGPGISPQLGIPTRLFRRPLIADNHNAGKTQVLLAAMDNKCRHFSNQRYRTITLASITIICQKAWTEKAV
jgi:hypothetical protein